MTRPLDASLTGQSRRRRGRTLGKRRLRMKELLVVVPLIAALSACSDSPTPKAEVDKPSTPAADDGDDVKAAVIKQELACADVQQHVIHELQEYFEENVEDAPRPERPQGISDYANLYREKKPTVTDAGCQLGPLWKEYDPDVRELVVKARKGEPLHASIENVEYVLEEMNCVFTNSGSPLRTKLCNLEQSYVVL